MHSYLLYCAKFLVTVRKCTKPPYVLTYTSHPPYLCITYKHQLFCMWTIIIYLLYSLCAVDELVNILVITSTSVMHGTVQTQNTAVRIPKFLYYIQWACLNTGHTYLEYFTGYTVGTTFYVQDVQLLSNHGYYINLCREPWQFREVFIH